jgi:predicted AAA+ superfamily ATPase
LFELASDWYKYGGKLLLIDEVHKYSNWSNELKLIYDGHPDLTVMFTSSSALDLYRGEADLSRRLVTQTLHGLSFREYLELKHSRTFKPLSLSQIENNHLRITRDITKGINILPLFKQYLREGYFPFSGDIDGEPVVPRLLRIINTVLESDLSVVQGYNAGHQLHVSPKKRDFMVDDSWIFEVGGKNKKETQIRDMKNAYLAKDDIEHGFANVIPLWLFGFLY